MIQSLIGGLLSAPALIALAALVSKLWPGMLASLGTWLYAHVDPGRLPYDSAMNRHWMQTNKLSGDIEELKSLQLEGSKDTIKNTLIALMDREGDQSAQIRYELSKLEALHATCWVMQEAEDYLSEHHRP
jgi:hypothetical protein